MLHAGFWERDVEAILRIALTHGEVQDIQIWIYEMNGKYRVRSGYRLARMIRSLSSGMEGSSSTTGGSLWKCVWAVSIPDKVKHFVWRCLKEIIHCGSISQKRLILHRGVDDAKRKWRRLFVRYGVVGR
ncbi:hypothetical protein EV1_038667 [Malus domestica]